MLLLNALVVSLLLGMVSGGRLTTMSQYRWRFPLLPCLALAMQIVAFLPDESASAATQTFAAVLHVTSYLLILAFVWINRSMRWLWLVGLGVAGNAIAILTNGGFMPVSPGALGGTPGAGVAATGPFNNSVLMGPDARLAFLGDVLWTPDWLFVKRAFSIGDVLIAVGAFAVVQRLMRSRAARDSRSAA
jgi:hypothetical protein